MVKKRRYKLSGDILACMSRTPMARWFAVAVIALNAIGQMFFIPAYR